MNIVEAIAVLLPELESGPFIYRIRDRVREEDPDWTGVAWDHPRVVRAQEAIDTLKRLLL